MEEQLKKAKASSRRGSRWAIIFSGFVAFFVAVAGVTFLAMRTTPTKPHGTKQQVAGVAVVRITQAGFEPATLSVKQGTKVVWTNTRADLHQIASNPYPKNNGLPNLKSEILNDGQTYSYVAGTAGSFGYHDDMQPTVSGTLVVEKK